MIPVLLVGAEVHEVLDVLMVDARLQLAPGEVAEVAQVHALLVVAEHVHALVRPQLLGQILQAELGLDQVGAAAERHPQRVVAGVVGGRADFVGRQGVARAACEAGGRSRDEEPVLEVAAGVVVVRLRDGAGVGDVESLGRVGGCRVGAFGIAVAAVVGADLALDQAAFARLGKFGVGGLGDDRAADAVAADADRRDPGVDADRFDLRRIQIGQRRVHVIGAGRNQIHAVDLDAQAVIRQTVDRGQAGYPAGAIQAHPRNVPEQARRVARRGAQCRRIPGVGGERRSLLQGIHHLDGRQLRFVRAGAERQQAGGNQGRQQTGGKNRTRHVDHAPKEDKGLNYPVSGVFAECGKSSQDA